MFVNFQSDVYFSLWSLQLAIVTASFDSNSVFFN